MERPPVAHIDDSQGRASSIEMQQLEPAQQPPEGPIKKRRSWWQQHIAQDVPFHECRDHYALERTYLAWLRTSIKFAHFGILVTQLFRLPRDLLPSSPIVSEFYRLGKPLGYVSISIALVVILVGGFRCWQQQQYMVSGKIRSCGWEVWIVLLLTLGYIIVILAFAAGDASSGKPV